MLKLLDKTIHRRLLQPLTRGLFGMAFGRSVEAAVPGGVDVVHWIGTGWELLGFPALRAARRRGAPFVVTPAIHDGLWGDSPLDLDLYRQADAIVALSETERERLVAGGVAADRVDVIRLAPSTPPDGDGERFRTRHGLGDAPLVLYVGRRQRYKGYHALAGAMEHVSGARLVSVGGASEPPFPPLPPDRLLDLGEADEQAKADALAACDVLCVPSAGESFGLAYAEAWVYGKPVVAGPSPAARELVRDGERGLVVAQEPRAIAEALIRLLDDAELRHRLGEAGRAFQAAELTWPTVLARHEDLYRRLAAAR